MIRTKPRLYADGLLYYSYSRGGSNPPPVPERCISDPQCNRQWIQSEAEWLRPDGIGLESQWDWSAGCLLLGQAVYAVVRPAVSYPFVAYGMDPVRACRWRSSRRPGGNPDISSGRRLDAICDGQGTQQSVKARRCPYSGAFGWNSRCRTRILWSPVVSAHPAASCEPRSVCRGRHSQDTSVPLPGIVTDQ